MIDLERELAINKNDKVAIEAQVENYKKTFAKELIDGGIGHEITESIKFGTKPIKIKKPITMRIAEKIGNFKNKLRIVFGID